MKICDIPLFGHKPFNQASEYGMDRSGTKSYDFNSCGYRSEEYDPNAKFRIAVVGCSVAFGLGLNVEETFAHRFKLHLASALRLEPDEVNLINMSVGSQSNDYCTRTIIRQIDEVQPNLFVYHVAPLNRFEYANGRRLRAIGVRPRLESKIQDDDEALAYFDLYNPEMGVVNAIRNILLAQYLFKVKNVDFMIMNGLISLKKFVKFPYIREMIRQIDPAHFMPYAFMNPPQDFAADNAHAGPRTNEAIAINMLEFYGRQRSREHVDGAGNDILTAAEQLKATSSDYAFVVENANVTKVGSLAAGVSGSTSSPEVIAEAG